MPTAEIIYWYAGDQMRMDGGGLRIAAWDTALRSLGYDCRVIPLWSIGGGVSGGSGISSLKRSLVPMPFSRRLPEDAGKSDLVVATVPATFADALSKVAPDRLILDWMDLWSVASRNVGDARRTSVLGGRLQSALWSRREAKMMSEAEVNVFAGYDDLSSSQTLLSTGASAWVPTPVSLPEVRQRGSRRLTTVGFIGNLDYPPNVLSLRNFLDSHLSALVGAGMKVVIAGYGSESVSTWGYPVEVLGQVPDVQEFYDRIDAAVVPIEHGGGVKVKALEAACRGVPVFGTDHVRGGLSPTLRVVIKPLEQLVALAGQAVEVPNTGSLMTRFSQESFTRDVASLLGRS